MQLKKYKEYLQMAKDAVNNAALPFKVKKAEKEVKIQDLLTNKDNLDWDTIIDAMDDRDLQLRKLKQLQELKDQLF